MLAIILIILALICFGLATFNRAVSSFNLIAAGLFFATLSLALPALSSAL